MQIMHPFQKRTRASIFVLILALVIPSAIPLVAATTFATDVEYPTGNGPTGIHAADLDGDSDVDLITANSIDDGISIFFNNGDGTYASAVALSAADTTFAVTSGDLDGDSDLDLVTANFGGDNVTVFINQGGGAFASGVNYVSGNATIALSLADLDGDTDLDIAAVNNLAPSNTAILLNNGNGTFAAAVTYTVGTTPGSIAAADLDGDLDVDLAVGNQGSDNVSILINNGSAVFAAPVNYLAGDFPRSIHAANFDGDGDIDLVIANQNSDNVSILLNNGNATFAAAVNYTAGDVPFSIVSADFDNDADQDVAVANNSDDNIGVFDNVGGGIFAAAVTYTVRNSARAVTAADLDGDGDIDIAAANLTSDSISVLLNNLITPPAPPSTGSGRSIPPLIDVEKVPSPSSLPDGPGPVTYTYTVTNRGSITMTNISVTDNACSNMVFVSGDNNGNTWMETNEMWIYRCTIYLSQTTINFGRARGIANDMESVDTAIVEVFVGQPTIAPLIHLVKIPQPSNLPFGGGHVNYSYAVTNPGTAPLHDVLVTDDVCAPVNFLFGDVNGNSLLESGETWNYQCQVTLTQTTVNTGVATGNANGRTAIDSAIAIVVVDDSPMPIASTPYSVADAKASATDITIDKGLTAPVGVVPNCQSGALIKLKDDGNPLTQSDTAVYYCGVDGKRYVFPNEATYFTWYSDFSTVVSMSAAALEAVSIGGNVTYRPGSYIVKVPSDSKFYVIAKGGVLRWLIGEETARLLYGSDWPNLVRDIPETFFTNYTIGAVVTLADVIPSN